MTVWGRGASWLVAGSGVVALLAVGGCGLVERRKAVAVVDVVADSPQDTSLDVIVSSCHLDPQVVRLAETVDRVEIEVDARRPGPVSMDCLDTVLVELDAPIGDRPVHDAVSGREIEPSTGP